MVKKPLIGVTLDSRESGDYAQYPWYALRENYCSAIVNAGGIPFPLTHDLDLVGDYLSLIDGLMITGGAHDVDPALYGAKDHHPTTTLNPQRTTFEMEITRQALKKNLPLLGICGGHQLLNVVLGGTLIQHIPHEFSECLEHKQEKFDRHSPCHTVTVCEKSFLYHITGQKEISVNSNHHQAIKDAAPGVNINAVASDGIIEGIEVPAYGFCLGIQWHPEYIVTPHDASIFNSFIAAARG